MGIEEQLLGMNDKLDALSKGFQNVSCHQHALVLQRLTTVLDGLVVQVSELQKRTAEHQTAIDQARGFATVMVAIAGILGGIASWLFEGFRK